MNLLEVVRLVREHPFLVELDLKYVRPLQFTAESAIELTRKLGSLKWFAFYMKNLVELTRFKEQLDDSWKIVRELRIYFTDFYFVRLRRQN